MTDRHSGYIVALEKNLREDDAQATLSAIQQIKGVAQVKPVVADYSHAIAKMQAETEFRKKLLDTFFKD